MRRDETPAGHMNTDQVAEVFGISREGVHKLVQRRQIPAIRIGQRLYIPNDAVMDRLRVNGEHEVVEIKP